MMFRSVGGTVAGNNVTSNHLLEQVHALTAQISQSLQSRGKDTSSSQKAERDNNISASKTVPPSSERLRERLSSTQILPGSQAARGRELLGGQLDRLRALPAWRALLGG